jgi:hypothetical protein
LIHPIAGRCKHCKGDLRAMRTTRPAAGATLPALGPTGAASPAPANGNASGLAAAVAQSAVAAPQAQPQPQPQQSASLVQAVAAAAPIPLAIHTGPADSVPILPPRPTGRYPAPTARASWKSWPVIVIILAVIAIIAAVVLMLFPPGGAPNDGTNDGTRNSGQPAPDRMNTNPAPTTPRQPPSTSPDPWSRRGGAGGAGSAGSAAPGQPPAPDDRDIDDPTVDDALTSRDPLSRRSGGSLGGRGLGSPATDMLYSIFKHACSRVSACSTSNQTLDDFCGRLATRPPVPPPSCAAATRCLRSIDRMSCDSFDDAQSILQIQDKLSDCMDAMSC